MKFIAFYLPQFHTIPENNKWWGDGFTEWKRVKWAIPLFSGHKQPRIPEKYYDLSDINILKEQAVIAKEHGIYGFCYYHYWFKGKKLLEKPLENMLAEKSIDMPFCLSWANEPWTRAWGGNPKEILMPQNYGDKNDWKKHLEYLLLFFKDERYIRINNKPVLLIYRTASFPSFDKMFAFWNSELLKQNIPGLYIVETLNSFQKNPVCRNSDAVVEFEPMYSAGISSSMFINKIYAKFAKRLRRTSYSIISYDRIWENIIKRNKNYKKDRYLGAFVDWDNTPRFGERGTVFQGASPEKFKAYLLKQVEKSNKEGMIFINAWNEWAEGAYLEADNFNGCGYLDAVYEASRGVKKQ